MEISMLALLRLCVFGVLLGAALPVLPLGMRLLRVTLLPRAGEISLPGHFWLFSGARHYFPGRVWRIPRFLRHMVDFFFALVVAVVLLLFFFAANDGVPRFVAVVCVMLGAWLFHVVAEPPLFFIGRAIAVRIRYFMILLTYPLLFLGKAFLRFLGKACNSLIKRAKRIYTISTSRRYIRRAPWLCGRGHTQNALCRALDRYEKERNDER